MIAGGAAAVILLIGSLAFYSIRIWTRAGDAVQAATAIGDMLELGEVDQAVSFLAKVEKADAGLLAYAPLVEARQRLQAAQGKETDRILQFDEMMRAVEQAPVIQRNPAELETARKLARQHTEKQAIEELIKRRMATLQGEQARHDKDVGPRLDVLSRKLAELEQQVEIDAGGKTDDPKILGLFADAQRTLIDVGPELPYVGDNLQSLARALDQKLDALRSRIDQRQQKVRLEGEMTGAVAYSAIGGTGNLVNFANGLDTYVKSLPNDPRSLAFSRRVRSNDSGTRSRRGTLW